MHPCEEDFAKASSPSTDKVAHHGYHRFYSWFLKEFRGRPVRLLEIGLDQFGSLHLWHQYFGDGLELHGIDRDEKTFDSNKVVVHKVDQGSRSQLTQFAQSVGRNFEIILDDGSHIPEHQLLTLSILWPLVVPGGLYIIEDIETSYWGKSEIYGYTFDATKPASNLIEQLRLAIDGVNAEFLPDEMGARLRESRLAPVLSEVEMASFGQNCVVLLKKDTASFSKYYGREYRFKDKIMSHDAWTQRRKHIQREGLLNFLWRSLRRKLSGRP